MFSTAKNDKLVLEHAYYFSFVEGFSVFFFNETYVWFAFYASEIEETTPQWCVNYMIYCDCDIVKIAHEVKFSMRVICGYCLAIYSYFPLD